MVQGNGPDGHLVVIPGSKEGNAVIFVRTQNKIRWSWHIWGTFFDPETTKATYHNGVRNYTFMDRNIGAISTTPRDSQGFGLLFQWGRKDPFTSGKDAQNGTRILYNINGLELIENSTGIKKKQTGADNNLLNTINEPMTIFIGSTANNYDWYTTSVNDCNDNLWGGITNNKTIYDPCPEGWTVPKFSGSSGDPKSPWLDLTSIALWNWGLFTSIGYYPAVGCRDLQGNVSACAETGYYYSGSVDYFAPDKISTFTSKYDYNSYVLNINYRNNFFRSHSFSVRCVKQ